MYNGYCVILHKVLLEYTINIVIIDNRHFDKDQDKILLMCQIHPWV